MPGSRRSRRRVLPASRIQAIAGSETRTQRIAPCSPPVPLAGSTVQPALGPRTELDAECSRPFGGDWRPRVDRFVDRGLLGNSWCAVNSTQNLERQDMENGKEETLTGPMAKTLPLAPPMHIAGDGAIECRPSIPAQELQADYRPASSTSTSMINPFACRRPPMYTDTDEATATVAGDRDAE